MLDWLFGGGGGEVIPEWRIRERQMDAAQSRYLHPMLAKRQEHIAKALELVKGCPPELNLQPYIDLVAQADALGLDVMRRAAPNTGAEQ